MPTKVAFVWETEWAGGSCDDVVDVEEVTQLMTEYLTNRYGSLFEDYGRSAWGGYDGPFIVKSKLTRREP